MTLVFVTAGLGEEQEKAKAQVALSLNLVERHPAKIRLTQL
jgi:hypothetical protein